MTSASPAYATRSLLRWTLSSISSHWHVGFQAFCLITSSFRFSSVSEWLVWTQAMTPSSSSWHLMIVHDNDHQDHEIWGKVMTPLLEINTAVQKTLHWFAPDLKGKSANIEISIGGWLDYRAPGSYQARKRPANILRSLQSNFLLYRNCPMALLSEKKRGKLNILQNISRSVSSH